MKYHKNTLNRSVTIGCTLFIIVLCVLLSAANVSMYKKSVFADYQSYISNILDYTLAEIDADDLRTCIETRTESEQYKKTLQFMDQMMDHFQDIQCFYAILPLNTEEKGNVMCVLSAERYHDRHVNTEGNLYLGWISNDEYSAATAKKFLDILRNHSAVFFEARTERGVDYTGAIPIRDGQGNSIAVLAVDIDISSINGMIVQYAAVNICLIILTGLVFMGIFLLWSRRNIMLPIQQLEKSAAGFADHSHGQRDTGALSFDDAVNKMTSDMRDYVTDIINAEKKAATMQESSSRDALTGIRNKTAYDSEIKRLPLKPEDGDTKFGLAIVDLNYLKKINDTYGHDKGNLAIKKLCRMVCVIFDHSPVFRIGGDEFAIILRGNDYEHYSELAGRFNTLIDDMMKDDTLDPWERVSAAIGVAFYDPELDDSIESLFKRADHAMYDRKKKMEANHKD